MKKLVLFLSFLSFSPAALGFGLYIDPYLGVIFGGNTRNNITVEPVTFDYDSSVSGYQLGSRVGVSFLNVSAGLHFGLGGQSRSADAYSVSGFEIGDSDFTHTEYGLFVGVKLPVLFRFWATYILNHTSELDGTETLGTGGLNFDSSALIQEVSGSGYSIGIGFTGIPFISLNLEYRSITGDELTSLGVTNDLTSSSSPGEVEYNEFLLSVSLPLSL